MTEKIGTVIELIIKTGSAPAKPACTSGGPAFDEKINAARHERLGRLAPGHVDQFNIQAVLAEDAGFFGNPIDGLAVARRHIGDAQIAFFLRCARLRAQQ
jgi:hypothetical protein